MSPADPIDLCFLPATELAALVLGEQAMEAARAAEAAVMAGRPLGPLHGVPIAIKDLDDVAGVPTSMGSRAVENRVPKTSTVAVERLLNAGAIILGKTNTPETLPSRTGRGHAGNGGPRRLSGDLRRGQARNLDPPRSPWRSAVAS
jgi:Asp-tRNA(Asn)/Glu-tRNA(Gln) amidotransferase A subunit family amidase